MDSVSQELDKTCQEQFVSTPQYMGPHLVGLEWLGVTQMSGGWNQPEASSLTCLVSGLGRAKAGLRWPVYWSFPTWLGLPQEQQLRIIGFLIRQPEAARASVLANKMKGT